MKWLSTWPTWQPSGLTKEQTENEEPVRVHRRPDIRLWDCRHVRTTECVVMGLGYVRRDDDADGSMG